MGSNKKQRKRPPQPRQTAPVHSSSSNDDFRTLYPRISRAQQAHTSAAMLVAELEAQLGVIRARLETAREVMAGADRECVEVETTMITLRPRLCFRGDLPNCVALSILGSQLSHRAGGRAAMVCREFRATVGKARELGLFTREVFSLSAGGDHTVACTQSGVYTFGKGNCGQLGHEEKKKEDIPRAVQALKGKGAAGASAGENHTVVWTEAGEVYTFGSGLSGELGHGVVAFGDVPRVVQALEGKEVVGASAGYTHTVVWTGAGEVYTFGHGDNGQLGHGGEGHGNVPRVVEALSGQRVVGASAGRDFTVVWTELDQLYTFGYGAYGRLGHGVVEDEHVPRVVQALEGKGVAGASAGYDHTVVWTESGELYTFGLGDIGQLGHGVYENETVPRVVQALSGQRVVGASAGRDFTVVWTELGQLYTFGDGECGRLGHGWEEDHDVPRMVQALEGKEVVGASAGDAHILVWTEAGEVYTFGFGSSGELGHGGGENEYVPRILIHPNLHN